MKKNRYHAKWIYNQCCVQKGKVKAECHAATLPELAEKMCNIYGNELGDSFSYSYWESEQAIMDCYGADELPEWFENVTAYPVHEFNSNAGDGTDILCNPCATAIINHLRYAESYGDYNLTVTGV